MHELRISHKARKFVALLRQGKFGELIELAVRVVCNKRRKRVVFYDRILVAGYGDTTPVLQSRLKTAVVREAGPADIPALEALTGNHGVFEKRFSNGDICLLGEIGGDIAGMRWFRAAEEHYETDDDYLIVLPPHSAWSFDAFIAPRYRYSGLWLNLTEAVCASAAARALKTIYCSIDALNHASVNAHLRYGTRLREQIMFVRLLFLRVYLKWYFDPAGTRHFRGVRLRRTPFTDRHDPFLMVSAL